MTTFTDLAAGWRCLDKSEASHLFEGQQVWMWSTGSMREAIVTGIGRTRVTVTFTQKNGTVRTKTTSVTDVCVPCSNERTIAPVWLRSHHDRRTLLIGHLDVAVWRALPRSTSRDAEGHTHWVESWEDNDARNRIHAVKQLNEVLSRRPGLLWWGQEERAGITPADGAWANGDARERD